jgi:hypothetical protein
LNLQVLPPEILIEWVCSRPYIPKKKIRGIPEVRFSFENIFKNIAFDYRY